MTSFRGRQDGLKFRVFGFEESFGGELTAEQLEVPFFDSSLNGCMFSGLSFHVSLWFRTVSVSFNDGAGTFLMVCSHDME